MVGIARLSRNWLVANVARAYVEFFRNIPLLLQLLFWYNAVLKSLPEIRQSFAIGGGILLNNRGLFLPQPIFGAGVDLVAMSLVHRCRGRFAWGIWARQRRERTGQAMPVFAPSLAALIGLPVLTFLMAGADVKLLYPELGRFNVRGGIEILPEFAALLFGLVIYTAAFIAEVVRAGILSVPKGQTEAAAALGLRRRQILNMIVDSAGQARHHSAADQPVSQPHQELVAGRRHRLSGFCADLHRHRAQPDRPGGRGRGHHACGLPGA